MKAAAMLLLVFALVSVVSPAGAQAGGTVSICLGGRIPDGIFESFSLSTTVGTLTQGEVVTVLSSMVMNGRIRIRTSDGTIGYISTGALCEWSTGEVEPTPTARPSIRPTARPASGGGFCDGASTLGEGTIASPALRVLILSYTNRAGGMTIVLNGLEQRNRIGQYSTPAPGRTFVVADVRVACSENSEAACRFNNYDFGLVVDGSYVVGHASETYSLPDNNWSTVFPGAAVSGHLVFEVSTADSRKDMALYFGDRWVVCPEE